MTYEQAEVDELIDESALEALESLRDWIQNQHDNNPSDGYGAALHTVLQEINRRIKMRVGNWILINRLSHGMIHYGQNVRKLRLRDTNHHIRRRNLTKEVLWRRCGQNDRRSTTRLHRRH